MLYRGATRIFAVGLILTVGLILRGRGWRLNGSIVLPVGLVLRLRSAGATLIRGAIWRVISLGRSLPIVLRRCLPIVIGLGTVVLLAVILLRGSLAVVVISVVLRQGWNRRGGDHKAACKYGNKNGTKRTHIVSPDLRPRLSTKFCGFRSEESRRDLEGATHRAHPS